MDALPCRGSGRARADGQRQSHGPASCTVAMIGVPGSESTILSVGSRYRDLRDADPVRGLGVAVSLPSLSSRTGIAPKHPVLEPGQSPKKTYALPLRLFKRNRSPAAQPPSRLLFDAPPATPSHAATLRLRSSQSCPSDWASSVPSDGGDGGVGGGATWATSRLIAPTATAMASILDFFMFNPLV